jgi:hypothetical protein
MSRRWAPASALLALLIILLGVVSPFVWASTADFWVAGIHDAESDNVVQAVVSVEGVVEHFPTRPIGAAAVVPFVRPADGGAPLRYALSALAPRAPPLS